MVILSIYLEILKFIVPVLFNRLIQYFSILAIATENQSFMKVSHKIAPYRVSRKIAKYRVSHKNQQFRYYILMYSKKS